MDNGVPFVTRSLTEMMATSSAGSSASLNPETSIPSPSLVVQTIPHPSHLAQYTVQGVKYSWVTAMVHQLNFLMQPAVTIVLMMSVSGVMMRGVTTYDVVLSQDHVLQKLILQPMLRSD